jgi:hypothetical protein
VVKATLLNHCTFEHLVVHEHYAYPVRMFRVLGFFGCCLWGIVIPEKVVRCMPAFEVVDLRESLFSGVVAQYTYVAALLGEP